MHQTTRTCGFTLVEMMTVLAIFAVLLTAATDFGRNLVPKQQLIAAANNLVGIIHAGRSYASSGAPTLLCAQNTNCESFMHSPGVYVLEDSNNNGRRDPSERIVAEMKLPEGIDVSWRSFRNKPWLRFSPSKISWYQNGNLMLCAKNMKIKVIVSRIGRPRVERTGVQPEAC